MDEENTEICEAEGSQIEKPEPVCSGETDQSRNRFASQVVLTPSQFAQPFGRSTSWTYRRLYAGDIQAITCMGRLMIPATEVDRILAKATVYEGMGRVPRKSKIMPVPTGAAKFKKFNATQPKTTKPSPQGHKQ